jgi:hypothetical protein
MPAVACAQATLVADAHVSSARPDVNAGTLTNLNVGGGYTALVQFDLSMLPPGTTAAQVTRALLMVYCNRADTPGLVAAQPLGSAWGEYSVTFATLPTLGAAVQTTQVSAPDTFVAFDVTATVQGWIGSPTSNNGLALTAGSAVVQFDSKENDETGHAPQLQIVLAAGGAGTQGAVGPAGPAGPQGVAGLNGAQGSQGPMGLQGLVGSAGAPGIAGPPGVAGPAGATGPQGVAGLPGNGIPGATGPAGPAGQAGAAGLQGVQGPAGVAGPQGLVGATGPPGLVYQGVYSPASNYALGDVVVFAGSSYASLIAGNHGNTPGVSPADWGLLTSQGPQGVPGVAGPMGPVGATGLGLTGPAGPQGEQGVIGPAGPIGLPGLVYQGAYAAGSNYALGDVVVFEGSSYASLAAANHGNTPGFSPAFWGLLTAQGAQGVQGLIGATGSQGMQGPPGSVGPTGEKGDQGLQGIPGQAGAQGLTGATGATGLQGPMGPQGVAGQVGLAFRGAYDPAANYALADGVLYQNAGYVSLVASNHGNAPDQSPQFWALFATGTPGVSGAAGATGPVGSQGATGLQGPTGFPGATGPAGPQGVAGIAGVAGTAGIQGPIGPLGMTGAAGAPGVDGSAGAVGPQGPPIAFAGAWSVSQSYAVGDAVSYGGGSYIAVAANVGRQPDVSPLSWGVLAASGAAGPVGAQGATGLQGPTGFPGATGPAGVQGLTGPQGSVGAAGPMGLQGVAGPQGLVGATGAQGLVFRGAYAAGTNYTLGDAVSFGGSSYVSLVAGNVAQTPGSSPASWGVLAASGSVGATGADGAVGAMGAQGLPGAAGAAGAAGPAGATGAVGMNFRGAWGSGSNYAVNDAVTFAGSTYLAESANQNLEPDTAPETWTVIAQAGGAGPTGAVGAPGAAAVIAVGSVTTLAAGAQATVTNSGTPSAAVLNFGIPQGAAGTGGTGGSGASGTSLAAMYHAVSFQTAFYAVNAPTASSSESAPVLAWVPQGCSAVQLDVFSQQSNTVTVTLRNGTPGAMVNTELSCSPASGGSCTVTGAVAVAAGSFIDFSISGTSGTTAGVWTQLECD